MLIKTFYMPENMTNCYLLADEDAKVCAIIDPGDTHPDPELISTIEREDWSVQYFLLTHGHYDHTMGLPELRRHFPNASVLMHPNDMDGKRPLFMVDNIGPVTAIQDGEHIKLGSLDIEVLFTPGHSSGSVVFKVNDVLFTGDTLFQGSIGRTDFPDGSYDQLMASIRRLGELSGDYRIYPGHMGTSTLETERRQNYYMLEAAQVGR